MQALRHGNGTGAVNARISFGRSEVAVDLAHPISLAMPVDFSGSGPRHFGAPAASAQPFVAPGFSGAVATGASCNCSTITLTPHCNGTHTECAGHLTRELLDAHTVVPYGLLPALLLSIQPVAADDTSGDLLITGEALERGWLLNGQVEPYQGGFEPRALVMRTGSATAYLSQDAAQWLVQRGVEHLIVDLPSIDRAEDGGRLLAHRIFFGLPLESRTLAQAMRPRCTVTELALIPQDVADGWYLLELQVPALGGDAVPSRPLLYPLLS